MAIPVKRPRFTREELLNIGQQAHEKRRSIDELSTEFGVHKSKVFDAQRQYRDSIGYVDPKATAKTERTAIKRVDAMLSSLPAPKDDVRIRAMQARIDELEDELTTMRKILMTVGRAL